MVDTAPIPVPLAQPQGQRPADMPAAEGPADEPERDHGGALVLDLRPVHAMASRFETLDTAASLSRGELLAGRVLKVTEEVGEAAQAFIGMTGRNPRKGTSHSEADLAAELCDVVLSALVALAAVDRDWPSTLRAHLAATAARTLRAIDAVLPAHSGPTPGSTGGTAVR